MRPERRRPTETGSALAGLVATHGTRHPGPAPTYSTGLREAFQVADHLLKAHGLTLTLTNASGGWYCEVASPRGVVEGAAQADSAAAAIALAALQAVGIDAG